MVYLKENIKDILLFLNELDIKNYDCFNQEKYIINILEGKKMEEIILYIENSDEQQRLNRFLRKKINEGRDERII